MRARIALLVIGLLGNLLLSYFSEARVREAPYFPSFYNPFPPYYQKNLVKVFEGLMPGTTTLEEVLKRYDYPDYVLNERYFFYRLRGNYQGWTDMQDVYIEFRKSKKLGMPRYKNGLDLTALVSRIYVYSDFRMGELATYIDQILSITPYPHTILYSSEDDYYLVIFPYQGYAMFFDGESGRFFGEAYFEPEIYDTTSYLVLKVNALECKTIKKEKLPRFLP